jgi:carboxynorspermidine decarboxylase
MSIAEKIPHTPCYVVDEALLKKNLEVLKTVQEKTNCSIILALKGFAMFSTFPLIREYLSGTTASSLDEARLGYEEFGGDVHVYAPAYKDEEFGELLKYASHINFNSFTQWEHFKPVAGSLGGKLKFGMRINPEHSEVKVAIYDPCAPGSRLGVKAEELNGRDLSGITGLHFHTLCELNSDSLERTLEAVEKKFEPYLRKMEWVNFGGGHHITRSDYDIDRLCRLVTGFQEKYDVDVYLEPGEAIALNTGVLVSSVLDVISGKPEIAILDTSAAAHMPDVLEMPYKPLIAEADAAGPYTYRLGGLTCLAGDVIGEYSFGKPLKTGDKLTFMDMAHYTMVKNNTFNGVRLPSIAIYDPEKDQVRMVRQFGYEDYKNRLS